MLAWTEGLAETQSGSFQSDLATISDKHMTIAGLFPWTPVRCLGSVSGLPHGGQEVIRPSIK
jgi:hypothetical protein